MRELNRVIGLVEHWNSKWHFRNLFLGSFCPVCHRIKSCLLMVCIILVLLAGCSQTSLEQPLEENDYIEFVGVIVSIDNGNWVVTTTYDVGFDKASVSFIEHVAIPFNPMVGQQIAFTIEPLIRESYPVQVTAVKVSLVDTQRPTATYIRISAKEAKRIMDEEQEVIVLDVRTLSEFQQGHIEGAILLPVDEIQDRARALLSDFDQKILVYCRSGSRSAMAARMLIEMGYTQVLDFGGIIHWPYEIVK